MFDAKNITRITRIVNWTLGTNISYIQIKLPFFSFTWKDLCPTDVKPFVLPNKF